MADRTVTRRGKGPIALLIDASGSGQAEDWVGMYSAQGGIGIELDWGAGTKDRVQQWWGIGGPSTSYDSAASACDEYNDLVCGAAYRYIVDDDANGEWAAYVLAITEADDTTIDFTAFPPGGIIYLDTGDDRIRVKTGAAASDATKSITTA